MQNLLCGVSVTESPATTLSGVKLLSFPEESFPKVVAETPELSAKFKK